MIASTTGLPPGTLAAWGLGYAALSARQPRLVLVSITPFGQDGPYSGYAANDLVVFAMGGLMFISGQPGHWRPPRRRLSSQSITIACTEKLTVVPSAIAPVFIDHISGISTAMLSRIFNTLPASGVTVS